MAMQYAYGDVRPELAKGIREGVAHQGVSVLAGDISNGANSRGYPSCAAAPRGERLIAIAAIREEPRFSRVRRCHA